MSTDREHSPRRHPMPCHVWVDGDTPGLMLDWQRQGQRWVGLVVMVRDGIPSEMMIAGSLLRLACNNPEPH